jgi:hypothetical protein
VPTPAARPAGPRTVALAALLVLGGCSSAAEPVTPGILASLSFPPTAEPTATRRATPSPEPTPSPTPTAPAAVQDLASELRIDPPYELVANRSNKALTGSFTMDVGGVHVEAVMNGREVWLNGELVGVALVMNMRGIEMNSEVFEAAAKSGANGRATFSTILRQRVAFVTNSQTTIGMYLLHGNMVMVGGKDGDDTKALLTSVIKAN